MQGNDRARPACRNILGIMLALASLTACSTPAPVANTGALALFNTCTKPLYPRESALRDSQGTTRMKLLVEANGRVSDGRIESSSGDELLDNTALHAMKTCRFKPAISEGHAVAQWTLLTYVWTIENPDQRPGRP
ncbi:hypothetical protein C2862_17670 [Massilia sp. Mn16-1_5]|nr:hypothetical protein C2862_17670 [Massilia sp. Mn16-1_5]